MALTIDDEYLELCMDLTRPAFVALALANDLLSWKKEKAAAEQARNSHVVNAVWVLMHELQLSEEAAISECTSRTRLAVAQFRSNVRSTVADSSLPDSLRTYVNAVQYSISGNVVWSLYCPRYGM